MAVSLGLSDLLCGLPGQQDGGVRRRDFCVPGRVRQRRQHGVVVEAEEAQKLIGAGQLDDLRERQPGKNISQLRRQAQAEHADCLVLAQHALCEHDVRQIDFAD